MRQILIYLIIITFLTSCLSYDKLNLYHKNYIPEISELLRFDGFYYEIRNNEPKNYFDTKCPNGLTPIFFYTDGSVFHQISFCNRDSLTNFVKEKKSAPYVWAIFDCKKDSITIEAYWPNTGTFNYDRYYLKGIIKNDSIIFTQEIDRKSKKKDIYKVYVFESFFDKPDSLQNFIMTEKRFNK